MSSDQGGEPQLQEEAEPGSKTRGEDETVLGTGGDSCGMVSTGLSLHDTLPFALFCNESCGFALLTIFPFSNHVRLLQVGPAFFNVMLTFVG